MNTYQIPQKMSNTGSIHDIESEMFPREIQFRAGCKYAVVLASYYGGKGYTTHRTQDAAIRAARRNESYSLRILDVDGNYYDIIGDQLRLI